MSYKRLKNIIISTVSGEIPTLSELSTFTLGFNIADGLWFSQDTTVSPAVVKQLNAAPRSYRAFVSQVDTDAPTADVIASSIRGIWYEYSDVGTFFINAPAGTFTEGKTVPLYELSSDLTGNIFTCEWVSTSRLQLVSKDPTAAPANGLLVDKFIYIEVLP